MANLITSDSVIVITNGNNIQTFKDKKELATALRFEGVKPNLELVEGYALYSDLVELQRTIYAIRYRQSFKDERINKIARDTARNIVISLRKRG